MRYLPRWPMGTAKQANSTLARGLGGASTGNGKTATENQKHETTRSARELGTLDAMMEKKPQCGRKKSKDP